MAKMVCPPWIGYFLLSPLRKFFENPDKMLEPYVREGMTVMEPGCGMGYFTLPLARMVGPEGQVVALDIQPKMLSVLERRAQKAGLSDRIELRRIEAEGLGVDDLSETVDFAVALHMVHEVPDKTDLFTDILKALKTGGGLLVVEPKGHVSQEQFDLCIADAESMGFKQDLPPDNAGRRAALLIKSDT